MRRSRKEHTHALARLLKQGVPAKIIARQTGLSDNEVEAARNAPLFEEPQPGGYLIPGETDQKWSNKMEKVGHGLLKYDTPQNGENRGKFKTLEAFVLKDASVHSKWPLIPGDTYKWEPVIRDERLGVKIWADQTYDACKMTAVRPPQKPRDHLYRVGALTMRVDLPDWSLFQPSAAEVFYEEGTKCWFILQTFFEGITQGPVKRQAEPQPSAKSVVRPEDVLPPHAVQAAKTVGGKSVAPRANPGDETKPKARQRTAQEELDLQPPVERVLTQMEQVTWVINQLAANHANRTWKQLSDFLMDVAAEAEKL